MDKIEKSDNTYQGLVNQISETYVHGKRQAVIAVNSHLIETYWNVAGILLNLSKMGRTGQPTVPAFSKTCRKTCHCGTGKGLVLVM